MADTAVAITAGIGTNIDTRTEGTNGNHRQVVVLGDPATNAGVAAVDATNGLSVNVTNASLTVASHAVTNAGTFATQVSSIAAGDNNIGNVDLASAIPAGTNNIGDVDVLTVITGTGATNLGKAEDGAHASGDTGVAILGVRRDTPISDCANGDYATLNVDSTGHLYVHVKDTQLDGSTYETVAASQTAQVLGAGSGATGDYISKVIIIPATTSPGNVLLLDNATSITIFTGGASSVSNLVPFTVDLGMVSASGAWKITTGANVSVIGVGTFT